jgi:hypothetical protein
LTYGCDSSCISCTDESAVSCILCKDNEPKQANGLCPLCNSQASRADLYSECNCENLSFIF